MINKVLCSIAAACLALLPLGVLAHHKQGHTNAGPGNGSEIIVIQVCTDPTDSTTCTNICLVEQDSGKSGGKNKAKEQDCPAGLP